jgi:hypothetical protein
MRNAAGSLAIAVVLAFAGAVSAQGSHERLSGTVRLLQRGRVEVEGADGKRTAFHLHRATRFVNGTARGKRADLKVGSRITVEARRRGERLVADEVRIERMATAAGAHAGHATMPPGSGEMHKDTDHASHEAAAPPSGQTPQAATGHTGHEPAAPATGQTPQAPAAHAGHEAAAPTSGQAQPAPAGHAGHESSPPASGEMQHGSGQMQHGQMQHGGMGGIAPMNPRNLFQSDMTLMAGMTPRDPMAGMKMPKWDLMTMGMVHAGFDHQGGASGDDVVEASDWSMLMAQRDVGRGRLTLMMMNSLEPATFPEAGSPQLFQTGETFEGRPLVDRQHPHDFIMNLSATYRVSVGSDGAAWLQGALRGEPALGPTAFMHRASAGDNPNATLGHHWQDSTHIADDVITAGGGWNWLAIEGSAFHGREPDERRWDLDPGALDSFSGRVKLMPRGPWSAQVSYGFLKNPEALQPGDLRRTTASLHYGAAGDRPFAATLLWGHNDEEHGTSDSFLVEAAYQLTARGQVYGRAEAVEKDLDLLLTKSLSVTSHAVEGDLATIYAATLGYAHDFELLKDWKTAIGGDLTVYGFPSELKRVYGDFPVSFRIFGRLRWGKPHGGDHGAHQ